MSPILKVFKLFGIFIRIKGEPATTHKRVYLIVDWTTVFCIRSLGELFIGSAL